MGFDINKPYRCRSGREAFAFSPPTWSGFVGVIIGDGPRAHIWDQYGRESDSGDDLINVAEKRTVKVWINVYPNVEDWVLSLDRRRSEVRADRAQRMACIEREITYEVGEGL